MMKILSLIAVLVLLTSCASAGLTEQEMALVQAQMQQQTLTINCPSGCSVQYKDPRDKVQIPRNTNGWDAAISLGQSVERLVTGAVPIVGMGYLGKRAIDALQGSGAITTTTTTTQTDNSSYVGDYSGDGSGATTTTTTTNTDNSIGDYSGSQSGNQGTLYSDNSGRITSPDDYTADPTVVDPVIVEQPEPVVVP